MSKTYIANSGLRYPRTPHRWDNEAPKKEVAAGGTVDEFAVELSPWILEQGRVSARPKPGIVIDEKAKAKLEPVTP